MPPPSRPLASLVIPAFNEGRDIAVRLERIERFLERAASPYDFEVIVVDDGSTDDTPLGLHDVARTYPNVRLLRHARNTGLGAAVRTGFAAASGSVIVTYDSDLSYDPQIILDLLEEFDRSRADLVLASPYMRGGSVVNVPFLRRLLSREANRFLSFAVNGRFATITCMVRAYRASLFRELETAETHMEFNPELFFKAIARGAAISEIPATLCWSSERNSDHRSIDPLRTIRQIARTMGYGIANRPAILLALPGLAPGVLPLVVGIAMLMHADLATIATVGLISSIIQYSSLAFFGGQLAVFGRNVHVRTRLRPASHKERV